MKMMRWTGVSMIGLMFALGLADIAPVRADAYADVREKLEVCFTCHGKNGASTRPEYPILAGQHLYYLYVQLKDFKSGLRADPVMSNIAKELSKEEMLKIAQFFSEQSWPSLGYRADPALAARGETATHAGECVQCHLGSYEGDSRIPRVANQHRAYLEKTMLDFKTGARANSPAKSSLMKSYDDADIAAMAEFLAGF
ncbi:MAG: cytochrome c4 [Alphaproteobacteria bacterium]|nr:MAG: cytochrome c4 [Alphaproteobacteria bacterium]